MRVTDQGTIPYPRSADSAPLNRLATDLKQLCDGLTSAAGQITSGTRTAQQSWAGAAADAFVAHATKRSTELTEAAQVLSKAIPALQTFARAIDTTQTTYVAAVHAERAARALTPYGEAAVALAIAAQGQAVATQQAAGLACGGALAIVNGMLYFELADDAQPSLAESMPAAPGAPGVLPAPTTLPTVDTTTMPNTAAMTEAQRYDIYREFFRSRGVDIDALPANQRIILGLRVPTNTTSNNGTGSFDDRIVVVWTEQRPGVNGGPPTTVRRVAEFAAATDPSAQYDATLRGTVHNGQRINPRRVNGEDGNFDDVRDLGRLPAGEYIYQRSTTDVLGPRENALRGVRAVQLERDVNHDGVFDQRDRQLLDESVNRRAAEIRARGGRMTEQQALIQAQREQAARMSDRQTILFHRGSAANTFSAGCQTFESREEWNRFWSTLGDRRQQSEFRYVLTEVNPPRR